MVLKIDKMTPFEEYLSLLSERGEVYIDNERLERATAEAGYIADDYKALSLLELRIESGGAYATLGPEEIIDYLIRIGVDMDKRYGNRKTKNYSLDMKRVVDRLIQDGVAVDILKAYKMYRSYNSYCGTLNSLMKTRKIHHRTGSNGAVLVYPTTIKQQENLRVYYRDIPVVNIPKLFSSIITGPGESYHLAWCDYPQADWRFAYNLFIKDESNREIMASCEDAYEGLARIVEGDSFNPEAFKESRKEYKVNCLSVFYNSSDKNPIPMAMRAYFRSRKKYARYVYDLDLLAKFKLPVPCTSYFGYTQLLPEASYPEAFISKGLNTPIQTFTSHVVCETVMGILKKFWDLGYTKEDIDVYYVRHDEPIFLFRDSIVKDAWVFQDCSQVHIDGFTPIKLDYHFGNYYLEEDPALTAEMQREMVKYPERITEYPIGTVHDYYPIPSVESAHVQFLRDDDNTCTVVYYDYRSEVYYTVDCGVAEMQDAYNISIRKLAERLNWPKYLYIRSLGMDLMDGVENPNDPEGTPILVKVVSSYDSQVAVTKERLAEVNPIAL